MCACQNPIVGYWNPLGLGGDHLSLGLGSGFWNQDYAAAIGFLRESEIKHGRVAMAAFVGFVVQSYGLHWPWKLTSEVSFADISAVGGPGAQWDAISLEGKLQIFGFIFLLEGIRESTYALDKCGEKHYMRGGKPGFFPSLKAEGVVPHPVPLDLFDPFGLQRSMSPEKKQQVSRRRRAPPRTAAAATRRSRQPAWTQPETPRVLLAHRCPRTAARAPLPVLTARAARRAARGGAEPCASSSASLCSPAPHRRS